MGDLSAGASGKPARISPAVTFQFEQFASRICDEAKVEFVDRPYRIREWMIRMEELFRRNVADGRTTDEAAAEAALSSFGPVENIVKGLRGGIKGLWFRLRFYDRYSVHRLLSPVAFCFLHHELRSSGSLNITIFSAHDYSWRFVMFGWDYYIGVITLASIVTTRFLCRKFAIPKLLGQIVALAIATALFLQIGHEWGQSVMNHFTTWAREPQLEPGIPSWKVSTFATFLLVCYLVEAISFIFVATLVAAEIFDLPGLRRTKREARV